MESDQGGVLDASQIEDLRGVDGGGLLAKLINMYLVKTPGQIQSLRTLAAAANLAAIAGEAHTLKGASGSIGATRVANACQRIEKTALAGDASPLEALLQALEAEFGRARDALQAKL